MHKKPKVIRMMNIIFSYQYLKSLKWGLEYELNLRESARSAGNLIMSFG
jgi:hypothetical protein